MGFEFFNPSRPDPGRREKIDLNFYFHTSLWYLQRFYGASKGFMKALKEATKKAAKKCEHKNLS